MEKNRDIRIHIISKKIFQYIFSESTPNELWIYVVKKLVIEQCKDNCAQDKPSTAA